MPSLENIWAAFAEWVPMLLTLAGVIIVLALIDILIKRRHAKADVGEWQFRRQITMLLLTIPGLVIVILAIPTENDTRNQLLSLLGLAITAVIALSSTTFVANAMAGILLRTMSRFKPGDFIRVGEYLGRVTERGLFHTEVQTEDRDLATFPNFYLISNPIKVVRASGTMVSATVSLGYDVPHGTVQSVLAKAAEDSGLGDTFTYVVELGDFSVSYRVTGFLEDVRQIISAPSRLRAAMLDALHAEGIEIVSPNFMIQRQQPVSEKVIADSNSTPPTNGNRAGAADDASEQAVMFDKAEAAGALEQLKQERKDLLADIEEMKAALPDADDARKPRMERGLHMRQQRLESVEAALEQATTAMEGEK